MTNMFLPIVGIPSRYFSISSRNGSPNHNHDVCISHLLPQCPILSKFEPNIVGVEIQHERYRNRWAMANPPLRGKFMG